MTETTFTSDPVSRSESGAARFALRTCLTIVFPVVLILFSVRVVMTPIFLHLEYHRPGFPEDEYGFTTADRLHYAPYALDYLFNSAQIDFLGNLTFPDGSPLFTQAELAHMRDVKDVTRAAFLLMLCGIVSGLAAALVLWRQPAGRRAVYLGLYNGALLTLGAVIATVLVALIAWDTFFTGFHQLFFESGTWRFAYSDTLIRLFPEQFWFDAALTIGGLTVLCSLVILFVTWRRYKASL